MLLSGLAWGCSGGGSSETERMSLTLPDPNALMPFSLGDLSPYPAAPDLGVVGAGAYGYAPRFPLWSNGSTKQRLVAVTVGSAPLAITLEIQCFQRVMIGPSPFGIHYG